MSSFKRRRRVLFPYDGLLGRIRKTKRKEKLGLFLGDNDSWKKNKHRYSVLGGEQDEVSHDLVNNRNKEIIDKKNFSKKRRRKFRKLIKYQVLGSVISSFILLLWFFVTTSHVYADSFYSTGDTAYCEFATATSLSIRKLPQQGFDAFGGALFYDDQAVRGERNSYPLHHTLFDVANLRYPDARRYLGVADRVTVPPDTELDVGLFHFNYSGHRIDVNKVSIFLSRGGWIEGNRLQYLLNEVSMPMSIGFRFNGHNITRTGRGQSVRMSHRYGVSSWSDPPKGEIVYILKTKRPLAIIRFDVAKHFDDLGNLIVHISSEVRNDSMYNLQNIEYQHYEYRDIRDIPARSNISYEYDINLGKSYSLDFTLEPARIKDPNSHTECAQWGSNDLWNYNPNSRVIFVYRNDHNALNWYAPQPDMAPYPSGDSFCITLIPYRIESRRVPIHLTPDISLSNNNVDNHGQLVKMLAKKPGESFTIRLQVVNNEARADELVVQDDWDTEHLDFISSCDGSRMVGNQVVWTIYHLDAKEEVSCDIVFRTKSYFTPGVYSLPNTATVSYKSQDVSSDRSSVSVNAQSIIQVSKAGDQSNLKSEDIVTFVIHINVLGNVEARNVTLQDVCYDCNKYLELLNTNWGMLHSGINSSIPIGDYTISYKYRVKEYNLDSDKILRNCFIAETLAKESRNCASVTLLRNEENGGDENSDTGDSSTTLVPDILNTEDNSIPPNIVDISANSFFSQPTFTIGGVSDLLDKSSGPAVLGVMDDLADIDFPSTAGGDVFLIFVLLVGLLFLSVLFMTRFLLRKPG